MRDRDCVLRRQCAHLRERLGFSEAETALCVGVSIERLRVLLAGLTWRPAEGIPLATVQGAIKLASHRKATRWRRRHCSTCRRPG